MRTLEMIQFTARRVVDGRLLCNSPVMLRGTLDQIRDWCKANDAKVTEDCLTLYGRIEFPGCSWELWPDETL